MTGLYIFLGILAVFLMLLLSKTKLYIKGVNNNWMIYAGVYFVKIKIYPKKKKAKNEGEPVKKTGETKEKKNTDIEGIKNVVLTILDDLKSYLHTVSVDRFDIDVIIATEDAAETGLMFGRASAAAGIIMPYLEKILIMKKQRVKINADFEKKAPEIRADIVLSTNLLRAILAFQRFTKTFHAMTKKEA